MTLPVTFLLFAAAIGCASSSQCESCTRRGCASQEKDLHCAGNLVKDACNCCYECARQVNETCGGFLNYAGTCDAGLSCHYPSSFSFRPGICTRKVQCHVYGGINFGQWIDVGQNFTLQPCSKRLAAEVCVCQEDGRVKCKKSREC